MPPKFGVGNRVRCLATRFDEGSEDRNGDVFSVRQRQLGHGEYCFGTVRWVFSSRGRAEQLYRVLWDGDATQMQSCESHLEPEEIEPVEETPGDLSNDADASEEDINPDNIDTDSDTEVEEVRELNLDVRQHANDPEAANIPDIGMGEFITVGGKRWKRVQSINAPPRTNVREFMLRNIDVTDETTELDLFLLMLPVTIEKLLEVIQYRAAQCHDKYGRFWYREHVIAYFVCVLGAAQYKSGTDLWSKTNIGMMPAPNFGQYLSFDRYKRVARYFAKGPKECDELLKTDAWAEFRWLLDGFNEVRKSEIHCSGKLNPDEAMFSWKGKSGVGGIPHLSFVKRKPKPLGLELKCVADAEIGVMLFMEIQEGAVRMGRKKYLNAYQATTACTLRLIEGCVPKDHNDQITAYIDAWFCSVKTAEALRELFQVDVIGCVKTAHKQFPLEEARWILSKMERGEQCVFETAEEDMWAVGWSDVHYKTYLTTCGSSSAGEPAAKKRQRSNGRNYYINVQRPSCIAEYATSMGYVDLHNRYRQGMLKLDEVIKTQTWQTRLQNELFATCTVDAFLLAKKFIPKWTRMAALTQTPSSLLFSWLAVLLDQLKAEIQHNDYVVRAGQEIGEVQQVQECKQIPIGKVKTVDGRQKGKFRAIQHRCRYCSVAKRYEERFAPGQKQGAIRTTYCCSIHSTHYMCKIGKYTCWQEHLADCLPLAH